MTGTKIRKPVETAAELNEYSQIAAWCNANGARIEDRGGYFEVVSAEPTAEETARQDSTEARLADIEDALMELAGMLAGGE